MSYKIKFSVSSARQFKKIRNRRLRERITETLEYIGRHPLIGKPLHAELKGDRSYRTGNFRVIYHIYKKKSFIGVLRIEHRKNVYRRR